MEKQFETQFMQLMTYDTVPCLGKRTLSSIYVVVVRRFPPSNALITPYPKYKDHKHFTDFLIALINSKPDWFGLHMIDATACWTSFIRLI